MENYGDIAGSIILKQRVFKSALQKPSQPGIGQWQIIQNLIIAKLF